MLLLGCCYCCLAGFECTKQTVANVAWCVRGEGKKNRSKERRQREGDRDRESGCRTQSSSESKVHVCVWVCQSMRVIKCARFVCFLFAFDFTQTLFMSHLTKLNSHTHTHVHIYITLTERERRVREPQTCAVNFLITRVLKRKSRRERGDRLRDRQIISIQPMLCAIWAQWCESEGKRVSPVITWHCRRRVKSSS